MSHCNSYCLQCYLPLTSMFLLPTIYQWDLLKQKTKGVGAFFFLPLSVTETSAHASTFAQRNRHFTKSTSLLHTKTPYFLRADFEALVWVPCSILHSPFVTISLLWKLLFSDIVFQQLSCITAPLLNFSPLLNGKRFWLLLEDKISWTSAAALTSLPVSQFPGQHNAPLFPAVLAAFSFPDFKAFILKL